MSDAPYGCQAYDINRLCRFDRREISRKCDGCPRTTDHAFLSSMGLWVAGISHPHAADVDHARREFIRADLMGYRRALDK